MKARKTNGNTVNNRKGAISSSGKHSDYPSFIRQSLIAQINNQPGGSVAQRQTEFASCSHPQSVVIYNQRFSHGIHCCSFERRTRGTSHWVVSFLGTLADRGSLGSGIPCSFWFSAGQGPESDGR